MKQIRLKNRTEIINSPNDCPCYDSEYGECNLDPTIQPTIDFPKDCPLEDYIEEIKAMNCPDRVTYYDKEQPNCIYSDMNDPCCIDGKNYRRCELTRHY